MEEEKCWTIAMFVCDVKKNMPVRHYVHFYSSSYHIYHFLSPFMSRKPPTTTWNNAGSVQLVACLPYRSPKLVQLCKTLSPFRYLRLSHFFSSKKNSFLEACKINYFIIYFPSRLQQHARSVISSLTWW